MFRDIRLQSSLVIDLATTGRRVEKPTGLHWNKFYERAVSAPPCTLLCDIDENLRYRRFQDFIPPITPPPKCVASLNDYSIASMTQRVSYPVFFISGEPVFTNGLYSGCDQWGNITNGPVVSLTPIPLVISVDFSHLVQDVKRVIEHTSQISIMFVSPIHVGQHERFMNLCVAQQVDRIVIVRLPAN